MTEPGAARGRRGGGDGARTGFEGYGHTNLLYSTTCSIVMHDAVGVRNNCRACGLPGKPYMRVCLGVGGSVERCCDGQGDAAQRDSSVASGLHNSHIAGLQALHSPCAPKAGSKQADRNLFHTTVQTLEQAKLPTTQTKPHPPSRRANESHQTATTSSTRHHQPNRPRNQSSVKEAGVSKQNGRAEATCQWRRETRTKWEPNECTRNRNRDSAGHPTQSCD